MTPERSEVLDRPEDARRRESLRRAAERLFSVHAVTRDEWLAVSVAIARMSAGSILNLTRPFLAFVKAAHDAGEPEAIRLAGRCARWQVERWSGEDPATWRSPEGDE